MIKVTNVLSEQAVLQSYHLNKGRDSRFIKAIVGLLLVSQLTACGTLLYPDRRGLSHGPIDAGVVALNAIGLLLFFVPGVVAFGVDFVTGTIYLPGGATASLNADELQQLKQQDSVDIRQVRTLLAQRNDIQLPQAFYSNALDAVPMSSQQSLHMAMTMPIEQLALLSTK
ncbi:hypothetical protein [Marinomonas sp. THO17]|uniref:hypothetical protein n=1 Tax=Marinomonas sp. THO17 TaxID=3149048 RepID=UPI00336BCE63